MHTKAFMCNSDIYALQVWRVYDMQEWDIYIYKSDKFCNSDTIVIHLPYMYAIICMSDKFAGLTSDTLK